ncbi:MAG: 1-deoxy-D-xylulose-5-phosphate synthase, partial [Planctomycetaceae bacterium]|nr:1-deoxy-D-xylulose-5-phosphate synthase [Planctomycetaceae bacterium]
MDDGPNYPLLEAIQKPADLRKLDLDQLEDLCEEIRRAICDQVAKSGGHLAPNLGVVELSVALHYVFDFRSDRLLFDVGHQCYPHKLLTGRLDTLPQLRKSGGLAGFPEPLESGYDLFSVGHAGTSIPTALGMARGDQINGETERHAVALVGDSSIVNGVALEGLNNAATLKRQFLVVLNDNGMSIGKPQGGLAAYFDRVRLHPLYSGLKQRAHKAIERLPGGETITSALEEVYHRLGEMTKAALAHDHMFEHFGMLCVGPIDGHDLPTLIEMLNEVKDVDRPVLLHCKTVKGKGYDFSTDDPTTFHSPKPFSVDGGNVNIASSGRSFTSAYADAMIDLMQRDDKVTCVTAGMPDGTGLSKVIPQFPERAFDVGIAESCGVDMCAGMAKTGLKPFATIYSTFMQRAFDQVFQEVSLQSLPVRFCMDRAGLVGGDGAVHQGFLDITFLRGFPNMTLLAPIDEPTLRAALKFMADHDAGPIAMRYPRDNVAEPAIDADAPPYALGKAHRIADGSDLAILAYGTMVTEALAARTELQTQGYAVAVYDARFAKPIDIDLINELIESHTPILTLEDHALTGGFGS